LLFIVFLLLKCGYGLLDAHGVRGRTPNLLRTDTKPVTHENMSSGTEIFYKRMYWDGHYIAMSKRYPLSSLLK